MNKLAIITSISMLCVSLGACSDDTPKVDHAVNVTGTYSGTATLKVAGQEVETMNACTIAVTRVDEESVTLRMDSARFQQVYVTDVTADAVVTPSSTAGSYAISGSDSPSGKLYTGVTFTGTIAGQRANIEITITVSTQQEPVVVVFEGSQSRGTVTIDASDYTRWVYFSFERGATVTVDDPANDLSWDIAFHRYDVKTNGGVSGKGQGAALETTFKKFNDVTSIPTSGYTEDVAAQINLSGMPPVYTEGSKNEVLAKWVSMDLSTMPPPTVLSKLVYIARSASGKYVKLLFTDNTNDEGVTGHVTFSYEIEP